MPSQRGVPLGGTGGIPGKPVQDEGLTADVARLLAQRLPLYCKRLARHRYQTASAALHPDFGTRKTELGLWDNICSPFLLLSGCERLSAGMAYLSSSVCTGNLWRMYSQAAQDMDVVRGLIARGPQLRTQPAARSSRERIPQATTTNKKRKGKRGRRGSAAPVLGSQNASTLNNDCEGEDAVVEASKVCAALEQLVAFTQVRVCIADVYRQLSSSCPPYPYASFATSCKALSDRATSLLTHTWLAPLLAACVQELKCLELLLTSLDRASVADFYSTMIALLQLKESLRKWENRLAIKSDTSVNISTLVVLPRPLQWMKKSLQLQYAHLPLLFWNVAPMPVMEDPLAIAPVSLNSSNHPSPSPYCSPAGSFLSAIDACAAVFPNGSFALCLVSDKRNSGGANCGYECPASNGNGVDMRRSHRRVRKRHPEKASNGSLDSPSISLAGTSPPRSRRATIAVSTTHQSTYDSQDSSISPGRRRQYDTQADDNINSGGGGRWRWSMVDVGAGNTGNDNDHPAQPVAQAPPESQSPLPPTQANIGLTTEHATNVTTPSPVSRRHTGWAGSEMGVKLDSREDSLVFQRPEEAWPPIFMRYTRRDFIPDIPASSGAAVSTANLGLGMDENIMMSTMSAARLQQASAVWATGGRASQEYGSKPWPLEYWPAVIHLLAGAVPECSTAFDSYSSTPVMYMVPHPPAAIYAARVSPSLSLVAIVSADVRHQRRGVSGGTAPATAAVTRLFADLLGRLRGTQIFGNLRGDGGAEKI